MPKTDWPNHVEDLNENRVWAPRTYSRKCLKLECLPFTFQSPNDKFQASLDAGGMVTDVMKQRTESETMVGMAFRPLFAIFEDLSIVSNSINTGNTRRHVMIYGKCDVNAHQWLVRHSRSTSLASEHCMDDTVISLVWRE